MKSGKVGKRRQRLEVNIWQAIAASGELEKRGMSPIAAILRKIDEKGKLGK